MSKHWRYFKYIIRHKWYVFVECCKLGIPWLGIIHDWSKFLPCEWFAYVQFFYGDGIPTSKTGGMRREPTPEFDLAWNHHQKCNKHHWQRYVLITDNDHPRIKSLPMPDCYRREMLADWRGAGLAINGRDETAEWYLKNRDNIVLHQETRDWIEVCNSTF